MSKSTEPLGAHLPSLTSADLAALPEPRVAIAGDWHGNIRWLQEILPRISRIAPDVTTILHLGDLGMYTMGDRQGHGFLTAAIPYWLKKTGIHRIGVTPGNHEQWPILTAAFAVHDGAAPLVPGLWAFPRGFRFTLGGRSFLSFSGAATYDIHHRTVGKDWWPDEEMATQEETDAAAAGGPVDVLLTHETAEKPTFRVLQELQNNRGWLTPVAAARSLLSRQRIQQVVDATQPRVHLHGHIHLTDNGVAPDGRRMHSLGMDGQLGNVGILDLRDLSYTYLEDALPLNGKDLS